MAVVIMVVSAESGANDSFPDYVYCGAPLEQNAFGRPLDYNDPAEDANIHANVERNHFNRDVEALTKGQTGILPLDIAYVLSQIPNHYRALAAMARWEREHGYRPDLEERKVYSADCYFRRALIFRPTDPTLHMLYGMHKHYTGDLDGALTEYLVSRRYDPNHIELNYNLGLLYVDLKEYALAREAAQIAYSSGFPLAGLRAKLQRLGEWQVDQTQ
ncbi:MAG: ABC transporter permease [Gammaproteobacteria bacterium]|nr:ABC transporter permease [Gammaproteobacteria bacterium]